MSPQRMTCCRCGHTWLDFPGAHGKHYATGCPKCGSLYWRAEDQLTGGESP